MDYLFSFYTIMGTHEASWNIKLTQLAYKLGSTMTRIFAVSQDWPITIKPPPLRRGRGGRGEENYVRKEEI